MPDDRSALPILHRLLDRFRGLVRTMSSESYRSAFGDAAEAVECEIERILSADDPPSVPRYLVLVDGQRHREYESEEQALGFADDFIFIVRNKDRSSVEVVGSVRRWELDVPTGEMLEVGERLQEVPV